MAIYILLTLYLMLSGILIMLTRFPLKWRKIFFGINAFIVMIIVAGLRSPYVGTDIMGYLQAINFASHKEFSFIINYDEEPFHFEHGYLIFTRLLGLLEIDETTFLFIIGSFIYAPTLIFFYKYSANMPVSVACYCCLQFYGLSLSAVRQMLAISIVLLCVPYLLERQKVKWFVGIIVAMLFHVTAIVMLPFVWVNKLKFDSKILALFFFFEGIAFIVGRFLLSFLLLVPSLRAAFLLHVKETDFALSDVLLLIFINMILIMVVLLKEKIRIGSIESLSLYALMGSAIVIILSFFTGNILKRINMYYFIFITLIVPWMIEKKFKGIYRYMVYGVLYIVLIGYLIGYLMGADSLHLNPYYFYWEY